MLYVCERLQRCVSLLLPAQQLTSHETQGGSEGRRGGEMRQPVGDYNRDAQQGKESWGKTTLLAR